MKRRKLWKFKMRITKMGCTHQFVYVWFNSIGALSSKTESFALRPWNLYYSRGITYSDALNRAILLSVSDTGIQRIQPIMYLNTKVLDQSPWIDDKIRFSFDSFNNASKILYYLMNREDESLNLKKFNLFQDIVNKLILFFYFFDHLNTHVFLKEKTFIFILGNQVSIETISLLTFTLKKYSFLKFKIAEKLANNSYLESMFHLNSAFYNFSNLEKADLCLLLGVNTRYEASYIEVQLKKRQAKSNLAIISIGSLLDTSLHVFLLGSSSKLLKRVLTGNSVLTQNFRTSKFPITLVNNNYFMRRDSFVYYSFFIEILKAYTLIQKKNWNGFNLLNNNINDVGINSILNLSVLKATDLKNFNTFYLIETPLYTYNLKMLLELKLLNFFFTDNKEVKPLPKLLFNHSSMLLNETWLTKKIKKKFYLSNYFYIPTNNFFEKNDSYKSTEGLISKSVNVIKPKTNSSKTDWQLLRQIVSKSKDLLLFTKKFKDGTLLQFFDYVNVFNFKNYIALQLEPSKTMTNFAFSHVNGNNTFVRTIYNKNYFFLSSKSLSTKEKYWLEDFFIGGKDSYTRHSKTMVLCSLLLRETATHFLIAYTPFVESICFNKWLNTKLEYFFYPISSGGKKNKKNIFLLQTQSDKVLPKTPLRSVSEKLFLPKNIKSNRYTYERYDEQTAAFFQALRDFPLPADIKRSKNKVTDGGCDAELSETNGVRDFSKTNWDAMSPASLESLLYDSFCKNHYVTDRFAYCKIYTFYIFKIKKDIVNCSNTEDIVTIRKAMDHVTVALDRTLCEIIVTERYRSSTNNSLASYEYVNITLQNIKKGLLDNLEFLLGPHFLK